jgi:histidinol-phosphate aminotransferase
MEELIRDHLKNFRPELHQPEDTRDQKMIWLNRNENSLGSPLIKWYQRFPDRDLHLVKEKLAVVKAVPVEQVYIDHGIEACIDSLYRIFCEPGKDSVIVCLPCADSYMQRAAINHVGVKELPLLPDFQLDLDGLEQAIDGQTKIIWLASPNDPSGVSLEREDMEILLNNFQGIVVIDESYINFSRYRSFLQELSDYPNLVVLQSLSHAWGLAGLNIGMVFASEAIIKVMEAVQLPYPVNQPAIDLLLKALEETGQVNDMIRLLVQNRNTLVAKLAGLPFVQKIYPSDANFLLVKMEDADAVYQQLLAHHIAVANVTHLPGCENSLRITIGTEREQEGLMEVLQNL